MKSRKQQALSKAIIPLSSVLSLSGPILYNTRTIYTYYYIYYMYYIYTLWKMKRWKASPHMICFICVLYCVSLTLTNHDVLSSLSQYRDLRSMQG